MLRRISEITLRRKVFMLGLVFAFCLVAVFTANNALFGKVTAFNGAETDANPPASGSFDPGDWVNDSSMPTARSNPAASLLPSGKLLVVGGSKVGQAFVTDAAIYDPVFSTWQAITPIPIAHRVSAQLLNTGEVLVVGDDDNTVPNPSSFLYNEGSSSWSATTGPPSIKRYQPALALLTTGSLAGQVLMAGGYDNNCCTGPSGTYNTTELYNPGPKTWTAGPAMNVARFLHTATVLTNGQVLVVGGAQRDPLLAYSSAELYTSGGSSWILAAPMTATRYAHTATRLPSGEVLVVGGANGTTALNSVELYNPTSDTWSTKTPMTVARQLHTATLLPSGKVLIAGGQNISGVSTDSAELYDPATDTWSDAGPLNDARGRHIAALLSCGRVLVAGGTGAGVADLASAEIYTQKDPFITVTPATLSNGTVGQTFMQNFSPVGGMGPFTYSQPSGDLPKGMTLQPDGKLTGIPEEKGSFTFTVKATDKNGCMGTVTITWQVDCPTIVISPATVHSGIAGQSYSPIEQLTATGGTAPYSYAVTSGMLPNGMTLTTDGKLQGTPMESGNFSFGVTVTDKFGCTGIRVYPLTIGCGTITIGPANMQLFDAMQGMEYNPTQPQGQTFSATGGCGDYTFAISSGQLPAGMSLSSTGVLSGVPTQSGDYEFTVKVTDKCGCMATKVYKLKVSCPFRSLLNQELFNTGVNNSGALLPDQAKDPHYNVTPPNDSAFVVSNFPGWIPDSDSIASKWISATSNRSGVTGVYTYKVVFSLANCDPNTAIIAGRWAADNKGEIFFNGAKVTGGDIIVDTGFVQWKSFTINSGFSSSSPNTIEFRVTNNESVTGLRVEFQRAVAKCCGCVPPPRNAEMISWWPFDGNNNDIRGGYHGTIKDDGGTYPPGMVKQGWRGNPDSQIPTNGGYVEVPDHPGLSVSATNSFSLDAWIYIDQFTDCNTPIVWKGNQQGQTVTTSVSLLVTGNKASQCSDSIMPHRLLVLFSDGTIREELESTVPLVTQRWTHVATTVSPTEVKLYIDGVLRGMAARKGTAIRDTDFPLQIGAFAGDTQMGEHYFNGIIDEVEFWRTALTEDEIRNIYLAFSDGKCKCVEPPRYDKMISWHPLDEVAGATTIKDIRGTHNGQSKAGAVDSANSPMAMSGKVNGSLYFDGNGSFPHVEVPPDPALNLASNEGFTIDAWINTDTLQTGQFAPIVDKIGFTGNFQAPISGYAFYVQQDVGGSQLKFDIAAGNGTAFSTSATAVNVLTPGWRHVAISYDRNGGGLSVATAKFYVDGLPVISSGPPSNDRVVNTLPLLIGKTRYTNDPDKVGGIKIDELEIFDVPLTQAEIDSIFKADKAGKCKPNAPSPCVNVNLSLTNQPNPLPMGTAGTAFPDTQFTAAGGAAPYMYTATGLPPGLSLSMDGKLTGTPTQQGTFTVTITVKDANGCTAEFRREIVIKCQPFMITPATLPAGLVGTDYKQTFSTNSLCQPVTYAVSGTLPPGLSFANGMLQGKPTQAGVYDFTINATDACGCQSRQVYKLEITDCPRVPINGLFNTGVDNSRNPLTIGVPDGHYSLTLQNGTTAVPMVLTPFNTWVTSANARWIGRTTGTPGLNRFTIQFTLSGCDPGSVSISGRYAASQSGYILLNNGTTQIAPTPANGASSFTNFTITSGFQAGLNTLTFVSQVGERGTGLLVEFTEATAKCCTCTLPNIGPGDLPAGRQGLRYSQVNLTVAGGVAPYQFSLVSGNLPAGMTLSAAGLLSGLPTTAGTFPIRVQAVDSKNCAATRAYSLVVRRREVSFTTNVVQNASLVGEQPRPTLVVNVMLNATIIENRWTFGIRPVGGAGLQPTALSNPRAMAGPNAANGRLTVNTSQIAQNTLGLEIALPSGQTLGDGQQHIFTLLYDIAPDAIGSRINFEFIDSPVPRAIYDVNGNVLPVEFITPPTVLAQAATSVSAASYRGERIAPEEIVAVFGVGLATATQIATTLPLPTTLAGTTIKVRDSANVERHAPLFFVAPTQINYLIPAGTAAGAATVLITSGDGTVSGSVVEVANVAPGIFTADASGRGLPAASALIFKADGAQSSQPVARFDTIASRFVAVPIDVGAAGDRVFLSLFGTGVRQRSSLENVRAIIGGVEAPVLYAGEQGGFAGLDQINLEIPRSLAGSGVVDVVLIVDGAIANVVQISIL